MILRMRALQSKAWRLVQASLELLGKIDIEQTLITLFKRLDTGKSRTRIAQRKMKNLRILYGCWHYLKGAHKTREPEYNP